MVPLRLVTLIVMNPGRPSVIVLAPVEESPEGTSRIVPIWIGSHEAAQMGVAIEGVRLPRPTTHDLMLDLMTNLDATVDHALIFDLQGQTFFAKLVLRQGGRLIELDARPTDALSLAIRQQAPFYIDETLLDRASFPYVFKTAKDDEAELEAFHSFLENLAPEDFENPEL